MTVADIKKDIMAKKLQPFYLFTGPEVGIMDIYINKMGEAMGIKPKRLDCLADLYSKLKNSSLLSGGREIYILRDDKEFLSQEKLWPQFMRGVIQKSNVVIFIYTQLDKRKKFYKAHKEDAVEFDRLSPQVLIKYIKKKVDMPDKQCNYLAELCDCDYLRAMMECEKITALAEIRQITDSESFQTLLIEGGIYKPPKDAIFDLVDSICRGWPEDSLIHLIDCKGIGESPLAIISVLYTNFRAMLMVLADGGGAGIAERTGLTPYQVKLTKEKLGAFSLDDLLADLKLIRAVEAGIKKGKIELDMAVDYLIVKILGWE